MITVKISFNSNESKRPFITGTALDGKTYLFEQMHFHWSNDTKNGSEHAINGKKFSGEVKHRDFIIIFICNFI